MLLLPRKPTVDEMLPSPEIHDVGDGDFKEIGTAIVEMLASHQDCLLRPDESILDVGCGIGRVAIPLTQYMSGNGQYEGFDVATPAIAYCGEKITPFYPNFRFTLADIRNTRYNPVGSILATEYRFPYADESFDFVLATSTFTHLLPESSAHYLKEITRVLKRDGRFLATYFLMDQEARRLIEEKRSAISFPCEFDRSCWVSLPDDPEAAVCYDDAFVRDLYAQSGLRIKEPIGWGKWTGRSVRWGGFQDQVIATRK